MEKLELVWKICYHIILAIGLLILLGVVTSWFWQTSFKVMRWQYCDKLTLTSDYKSTSVLTGDADRLFICNF